MYSNKSVIVKKFGDLKHTVIEPYTLPSLEGRIEIEVHYCGVNFSDLYTRLGFLQNKLPFILGSECSGVISAVGIHHEKYKVGERVICYDYKGGLYSDIIRVPPECIFHLPSDIPLDIAATLFVNYLTAYFAVLEFGNLKPHESILINSCAGGVGTAATQLAKTVKNVTIYGTASPSKAFYANENGVDRLFTYEDVSTELKKAEPMGVDVIIENQSSNTMHENLHLLKPMGRMVLIGINSAITQNYLSYFTLFKIWMKSWWFSLTDLVMHNRCIAGLHLGTLLAKDHIKVRDALYHILNYTVNVKLNRVLIRYGRLTSIITQFKR
ncbi:synaptic vesicle membrane protein vat-1 -like [Holotrichia oblita]|uniref:Synaptic vesicle membrane protein vat-1 -like n=1 Tax=Holotrichia oblita TaxID=644536 RepID=A0ACB9ST83_HOLOL|nr:synaptic vesicle membrane protein vat-1 -like [Holotrichia oblita]